MPLTRRTFLELLGASTAFAVTYSCAKAVPEPAEPAAMPVEVAGSKAKLYYADYTDWLLIHPDGSVTAHTGRVELGQGLTTVLSNVISQGLQLPPEAVKLVMGDTALCPDDGPTTGSAATRIVGWGYWRACDRIRAHLVERAAEVLGVPATELVYRDGGVAGRSRPDLRVGIGELVDGKVHLPAAEFVETYVSRQTYSDPGAANVNGEAIVTGTLRYTGDLFPGEVAYASWLLPEYHTQMTRLRAADLEGVAGRSGVGHVQRFWNTAMVVGDSYPTVERACAASGAKWKVPERSLELDVEAEIRAGAELHRVVEERGDPTAVFKRSPVLLSETYITQYASQTPIETETAVAEVDGDRVRVWASTQAPFISRGKVARQLGIPADNVHVIAMPVGGGFGVKGGTRAPQLAAEIARASGRRVKVVFDRDRQFNNEARYKESVVADIASAVAPDGRLLARTLDLYQDEGAGSTDTYDIPDVRTRLFRTPMPARHGVMRGTSFVQTCFAVESHTDVVAEAVGLDPVTFRKRNLAIDAFAPLLDACAERIGYGSRPLADGHGIGYGSRPLADGHGIGFAICNHGGRQLGAVAAEVAVDRGTGVVRVERLEGAFDIGLVISRTTLVANTVGAMIWGLGFALFEEVRLDGHRSHVHHLSDYRIPRFSDVPPIEVSFHDNLVPNPIPRGCGELPTVPTIGAIANAVYAAVGLRFHTLPITPARVLAGLREL